MRVALTMVEDNDIIRVKLMDKSLATELLRKKLGYVEDGRGQHSPVDDFAIVLDFIPLAMVQILYQAKGAFSLGPTILGQIPGKFHPATGSSRGI